MGSDRYAAEWPVGAFRKCGSTLRASDRDRSAIYADALPLFTSGRARLLDNPRLVNEFASLERKTTSLGRDKIDHGPGGNDDLANAAALSMVLAATEKKPMTFHVPFVATAPSYFRSFESGAPMAAGLFDGGSSGQPGGSELPSNAEARRQATERLNRT